MNIKYINKFKTIIGKLGFELLKVYQTELIQIFYYKKHELLLDLIITKEKISLVLPHLFTLVYPKYTNINKDKIEADIKHCFINKLNNYSDIFITQSYQMFITDTLKQRTNKICGNCSESCFNGYEYCDKYDDINLIYRNYDDLKYERRYVKCLEF